MWLIAAAFYNAHMLINGDKFFIYIYIKRRNSGLESVINKKASRVTHFSGHEFALQDKTINSF